MPLVQIGEIQEKGGKACERISFGSEEQTPSGAVANCWKQELKIYGDSRHELARTN